MASPWIILQVVRRTTKTIPGRCFQTRADYESWSQRMKSSRLLVTDRSDALQRVNTRVAAPFLYSVSPISDRLLLFAATNTASMNSGDVEMSSRSPFSSMLECLYPLSGSDHHGNHITSADLELIRSSISDFGSWSSFRLAKFYSDVDALTADAAYRHVHRSPHADHISFVTAGHFNSRKIHKTDLSRNLILRCYPTSTGRSSIEIRTDAILMEESADEEGAFIEKLVNVCLTSMVAVDNTTLRPVKNAIPALALSHETNHAEGDENSGREQELQKAQVRAHMAEEHNKMRKQRFASSMQLRGPPSSPPTQEEMSVIHKIHQENLNEKGHGHSHLPSVEQFTFHSSAVVNPERRNVHRNLFGGFAMEQGHILAQYAANVYLNHYSQKCQHRETETRDCGNSNTALPRAIPLGLDEAIFLQPVSIGGHVAFTARVVHSTRRTCRVVVTVEVRDPSDRHSIPLRSNRLSFLFGGRDFPSKIVPNTYSEILMQVDAQRRARVEGPWDEEVDQILLGHSSCC